MNDEENVVAACARESRNLERRTAKPAPPRARNGTDDSRHTTDNDDKRVIWYPNRRFAPRGILPRYVVCMRSGIGVCWSNNHTFTSTAQHHIELSTRPHDEWTDWNTDHRHSTILHPSADAYVQVEHTEVGSCNTSASPRREGEAWGPAERGGERATVSLTPERAWAHETCFIARGVRLSRSVAPQGRVSTTLVSGPGAAMASPLLLTSTRP